MKLEKYIGCSQAARKLIKSDLVLKNAKIVNVFTDRVEEGNVAVKNGMIVVLLMRTCIWSRRWSILRC